MVKAAVGFETLEALVRISNEIPPLKRDIKALELDIKDLMGQRDRARDALYLVVNAVNRNLSPGQIKRIAVRGMARSKSRRTE